MEGTQEEQISYLSDEVPIECVLFMPVSLTKARGPVTICTVLNRNQHKSNHLARNHPRKKASPIRRPKTKHSSSVRCARVKISTRVQLPALQPTNARFTPGRETSFLKKLGRPLQKTRCSNQYGVCCKCSDLHTNPSRHSSGCDRTPSDTIPLHSDRLVGEPSARNPATPSTPAPESFNQSEQSSTSILLPWKRRYGAHTRCSRRKNPCQNVSLHGKRGPVGASNAHCPQPEACPTHCLSSLQCSTGSLSRLSPRRGPRH